MNDEIILFEDYTNTNLETKPQIIFSGKKYEGSLSLTKSILHFKTKEGKKIQLELKNILNVDSGGLDKENSFHITFITKKKVVLHVDYYVNEPYKWIKEIKKAERKRLKKLVEQAVSKGGLDNYQETLGILINEEKYYGKHLKYLGRSKNYGKMILKVKMEIATEYEKLLDYNKAIEAYKDAELPDEVIRIKKLLGDDKVEHLDYDKAIEIYESIGDKESAKNARKIKAEQGAVKVTQKVVHGDEVTKTEIKDSVLNRSNVGGGSSKMQELKDLTEMKREGLIDDAEFKQMKKEILGK
jgi:tetratricopeptide (TPR) repeat protein